MDPGTSQQTPNSDTNQSKSPTPSKPIAPKPRRRRNNEAKRSRGEISCAECRRLKMKCDKQIPCGTCTRRGCANICPHGVLSGGQGSRLILADTGALHGKITQMSQRIRQLEDALGIMQADVSKDRHPLLTRELLRIKHWPEDDGKDKEHTDDTEGKEKKDERITNMINAMGTLTIGEHGEAKYFGQSAGSESLLHLDSTLDSFFDGPGPMEAIPFLPSIPGITRDNPAEGLTLLESSLPPLPRAWSLIETYYAHSSAHFRPIKRSDLVDEILTPIYRSLSSHSDEPGELARKMAHKFGVLYLIFALGALTDLTLPPFAEEAHRYFLLARNAVSVKSVTESPAIETVQALALVSSYHSLSGRKPTSETSWSFTAFSMRMALSIGLHRDCARWGLDGRTIQRRRYIFWEIYTTDVLLSLALGRPPTISLSFVDCAFPLDEEATLADGGEHVPSFYAWKYSVAKDILGPIIEALSAAQPMKYETVLDFDRKIRQKAFPKGLNFFVTPDHEEYHDRSASIRTWLVAQYRLFPMFVIHRPYFAQALLEHPGNPFRSPYAPSFLAAYHSASLMIKRDLHYFERVPDMFLRAGGFWQHPFTAAVIMGLVVVRMPKSHMALNALGELNLVVDLFEKGAAINIRAQRGLIFLRRLRSKAQHAFFQSRTADRAGVDGVLSVFAASSTDGSEELALFGGQTKVLPSKFLSKYWTECSRVKSASSNTSTPTSGSTGSPPVSHDDMKDAATALDESMAVHQSLVDYLGTNGTGAFNFGAESMSMDWTQTSFEAHFPDFLDLPAQYPSVPVPVEHLEHPSPLADVPSFTSLPAGAGDGPSSYSMEDDFVGFFPGLATQEAPMGQPGSSLGMDPQFISLMQSAGLFEDGGTTQL